MEVGLLEVLSPVAFAEIMAALQVEGAAWIEGSEITQPFIAGLQYEHFNGCILVREANRVFAVMFFVQGKLSQAWCETETGIETRSRGLSRARVRLAHSQAQLRKLPMTTLETIMVLPTQPIWESVLAAQIDPALLFEQLQNTVFSGAVVWHYQNQARVWFFIDSLVLENPDLPYQFECGDLHLIVVTGSVSADVFVKSQVLDFLQTEMEFVAVEPSDVEIDPAQVNTAKPTEVIIAEPVEVAVAELPEIAAEPIFVTKPNSWQIAAVVLLEEIGDSALRLMTMQYPDIATANAATIAHWLEQMFGVPVAREFTRRLESL